MARGVLARSSPAGAAALDALFQGAVRPDMIVTDDPMPGLSGVRLAQQVHGRSPDPPVVPVTGSVEGFDAEALRSHGTAIRVLFR